MAKLLEFIVAFWIAVIFISWVLIVLSGHGIVWLVDCILGGKDE